jgi:hypothetical protein
MPGTLTIQFKKKSDGSAALSCRRADGSVTWQRQEGAQAGFFPRHDLTHYAVESVLGAGDGFYGLLSQGWNITDFGPPWPRGSLPEHALNVELIVGLLDGERAGGNFWTAEEFNRSMKTYCESHGRSPAPALTDDQLDRIRLERARLFGLWAQVSAGDALELTFPPGDGS